MEVATMNQTVRIADPLIGKSEADSPDSRTDSSRTILVVDDNEDIRETMVAAWKHAGYAAESARDGAEALTMLRKDEIRPCLILLDLMMPVMDGLEFREQQLRDPAFADILWWSYPLSAAKLRYALWAFRITSQSLSPLTASSR
jgi:CheY-like chemotaxis protein